MSAQGYKDVRASVLDRLRAEGHPDARWDDTVALLDLLVLGDFEEFLTVPGAKLLD
jgi:hypothetical protein